MKKFNIIFATLLLILCAARVEAQFSLVARVDPFAGNNVYADVWGAGNYAYVGSYAGTGVGIFDISSPASAFLATHYNPGNNVVFKDVKVANGIGYFASDNGFGVHVVNLSNPASPSLLSTITSSTGGGYNSVHNLFISGNYLYQADSRTSVVKVINVSNPSAPTFVRNITATDPSFIHDITVVGNRLYTSGFGGKTDIYDVSAMTTTQAPTLLGSFVSGSNSHSNWVTDDGKTLVSAREINNGDIRIFDITNPANVILRSSINKTDLGIEAFSPHNPLIVGNKLYVSWYEGGLQAFDISNPANPVRIGSFGTWDGTGIGNWGVYPFLGEDRILLSDSSGGLFIVTSVPEPASLCILGAAFGSVLLIRNRRRRPLV